MRRSIVLGLALILSNGAATAAPPRDGNARPVARPMAHPCDPDALGTSRTLVVGTTGGLAVGLKTYPRTLPLADHEVVLTFDDGPAATTPAVLDALERECVKATFFLIGRNAAAQPDVVRRARAAGHTLGHHSFSHPGATLRRMSLEAAKTDIQHGFAADDLAAYGTADDAPRTPFFRFPGFADTPDLMAALARRDIAVFGTDIWAYDWLDESPQAELGILMRQLEAAKRGMILLHDSRPSTAIMLPVLLRVLKAEGYRIVHVVPGPGQAETVPAPQGWTSETERIIAEVFRAEQIRAAAQMRRPVLAPRPYRIRVSHRRRFVARRARSRR